MFYPLKLLVGGEKDNTTKFLPKCRRQKKISIKIGQPQLVHKNLVFVLVIFSRHAPFCLDYFALLGGTFYTQLFLL